MTLFDQGRESPFDLNTFFRDGYSITRLGKPTADRLLQIMDRQEYTDEDEPYGLDNPSSIAFSHTWGDMQHPKAPSWDKKEAFNQAPLELQEFWNEAAKSDYFKWFTDLYGDFTHLTIMAHRYTKGDGMGFHHDVLDATWLLNLIYLVDEPFDEEDGGYLGVGRCIVNPDCVPIKGTETEILKVIPTHGLMLTLNNRNPSVLHRVQKMVSDKVRRVIVCQMGYIESILHREALSHER